MPLAKIMLTPFHMIFGHLEALGFLYLLTKFPTLIPSGKRENEGEEFVFKK